MKTSNVLLAVGLVTSLVAASCWGTDYRFFRITCAEGGAPENLAISSDESGQIFLEFDTQDQRTYVIEATDHLAPTPLWEGVSTIVGDGQRARWLTPRRWSRTFGGIWPDVAYSVQQTSDGGYILAGYSESFGSDQAYLIKTDSAGSEVWTKTFGERYIEEARSVQQTSDGGYIVAGFLDNPSAPYDEAYLVKRDANGDEVWSKTFGGDRNDRAYSVQQTSDGGYIVAGYTESFGAGASDAWLIKTDSAGDEVWSETYGGSGYDRGYCVQQTSDGGYVVAGVFYDLGAGGPYREAYLIKTDADGNEIWGGTFGTDGQEEANSVQQTSDGGYIVAAWTMSPGEAVRDVYLIRVNNLGGKVWSKTFGGSDDEEANCVLQTSDGAYLVAGSTRSFGAGGWDAYLIKADQNGDEIWSKTFGGTGAERAYSAQQTSDGGYILAGSTSTFGVKRDDVYLIKTDQNGNAPLPE